MTFGFWAKALLALWHRAALWVAAPLVLNLSQVRVFLLSRDTAWNDPLNAALEAQIKQAKEINALAMRVAELQAKLLRLDALGERISSNAQLDLKEFDFSQSPGLGGPVSEGSARCICLEWSLIAWLMNLYSA